MASLLRLLWLVLRKNPGGLYSLLARAAAEGVFGSWIQRLYLWSSGKKTKTGLWLGLAYLVTDNMCSLGFPFGCHAAYWIGWASVGMLGLGVTDASAHAQCPTSNIQTSPK
jgi:hypothetical protein